MVFYCLTGTKLLQNTQPVAGFMALNTTFNSISVISCWSFLWVEETCIPTEQPTNLNTQLHKLYCNVILYCRYLYGGTVEVNTETVLPVLLLADKYGIKQLCESCVSYMMQHIVESPDSNRTLSWYQYAKMTSNQLLQDKCRQPAEEQEVLFLCLLLLYLRKGTYNIELHYNITCVVVYLG
jgi:hypothetical protein